MKRTSRVKYFSKEEAAAFLDALEGARDRLAFHVLYRYRLRVGELAKLWLADFRPSASDPRRVYVERLESGISRHYPVHDDSDASVQ
jgi:integrase